MRLATTLVTTLALWAAASPAVFAQDTGMVGEFKLPGGAAVVTEENHQTPRVVIDTWIHAGSAQDPTTGAGTAFVTAHTLWAGKAGLLAATKALGGEGTVEVEREFTHFQLRLPSNRLDAGLQLVGQTFSSPNWADLATDTGVKDAREQLTRINQDRDASAFEAYMAKAYGTDYGHPVAGDEAGLGRLGKSDVRAYFERHYVASRLRVVLAGDFDTGRAVGSVVRSYAAVLKRVAPADGPAARAAGRSWNWQLPQPVVVAGLKGPGIAAAREQAAIEMIGHVVKARLEAKLEAPRIASLSSSRYARFSVGSPLVLTVASIPDATPVAERTLETVFSDLRQNTVSLEEHARAQAAVATAATVAPADLPARARGLGFASSIAGDPYWLRTYPEIARQVSRQDMLEAVQKYATPMGLTVTTYGR